MSSQDSGKANAQGNRFHDSKQNSKWLLQKHTILKQPSNDNFHIISHTLEHLKFESKLCFCAWLQCRSPIRTANALNPHLGREGMCVCVSEGRGGWTSGSCLCARALKRSLTCRSRSGANGSVYVKLTCKLPPFPSTTGRAWSESEAKQ